jgi:hypothetical protein
MGIAKVREATPADLPGIARLLGIRDGLPGPHPGAARALLELDPDRIRAWVAVDPEREGDDAIVGLTCAELHRLQVGDRVIAAGYWTNLYIREDYRDQLLYPRLPQAMLRALKKSGVERVYLAIRRLEVAEGHLRIGFREIDRLVVRLKPLRPLSLLGKHVGAPGALVRSAAIIDRVAGLPLRLLTRRPRGLGRPIEALHWPADAEPLAQLLSTARADRVTRRWDPETLVARFQPAADGQAYTLLGLRRGTTLVGAVVTRVSTREGGLQVGVILELVARDDDPRSLMRLLDAAERGLYARGVEGVVALDALGPAISQALKRSGYVETPERYVLMIAPKRDLADDDPLLDASAWRFPLSDHDAF